MGPLASTSLEVPVRCPRSVSLLLLIVVGACAPDIAREPVPPAIVARFDPARSIVPIPTDLVRDPETGMLQLPVDDPALTGAERELRIYLNTLDGFPVQTGAEVQFGMLADPTVAAAVDPSSLTPDTYRVLEATTGEVVAHASSVNETGERLMFVGDDGDDQWPANRTVVIALRGGPAGVRSLDGAPLEAEVAFHLLRGREPLEQYAELFPGDTAEAQLESARRLEEVRQRYQPHFELLEASGLPREEVAILWSFTLASDGEYLVYDPLTARVPFPNDIARDASGLVELPPADGDSEEVLEIKAGLSGMDGFSTSGAITFSATVPIAPATFNTTSARIFEVLPDGTIAEVTRLVRQLPDPGNQLAAFDPVDVTQPMDNRAPLRPGTRHVVIVTDEVMGAGGVELRQMPFTAIMKFQSPLVENGKSALSVMDDATATRVEPLRAAIASAIDQIGVPREQIRLVYSFTTFSAVDQLRALADEPYVQNVPLTIDSVTLSLPLLTPGIVKPMPNTAYIATGTIPTFERLDKVTRAFPRDGSGHLLDVGFSACIPNNAVRGRPMPVAVFGHGLTTAKELVYLVCDDLAAIGIASIGIDFPYHGDRSICLADTHCSTGHTCRQETGECVDSAGNVQPVREDFIIWSQNIPQPVSTGEGFVDLESLFASRDHVLQSIIDMSALVRSIREADWGGKLDGYVFDGDDISYYGISLGGILGSYLSAAEPNIGSFALNVPGAGFVQLMQDSPRFQANFFGALEQRGILPGSPEFFQFVSIARWIIDPADPMNVVRHSIREPYTFTDPQSGMPRTFPKKRVLVQMANPDEVVPNTATRILARQFGVPISSYAPVGKPGFGGHIFLFDPSEPEGTRAMSEIKTFLQARKP